MVEDIKTNEMENKEDKKDKVITKADLFITKADLFRTIDDTVLVEIDLWGGQKVPLRPLSDGLWQEMQVQQFKGIKIDSNKIRAGQSLDEIKEKVGFDVDFADVMRNNFQTKCEAVAYMIFGKEEVTVEEVKELRPPGIVEEIYRKGLELSGVNSGEAVKTFRK